MKPKLFFLFNPDPEHWLLYWSHDDHNNIIEYEYVDDNDENVDIVDFDDNDDIDAIDAIDDIDDIKERGWKLCLLDLLWCEALAGIF